MITDLYYKGTNRFGPNVSWLCTLAYLCFMNLEYTLNEIEAVATKMVDQYGSVPVWAFYAPMGAGKTTLIAAIAKAMGITDQVASPTFALMNEYRAGNKVVCHMDWYRLEDEAEAVRAGMASAIEEADQCFIEWPEKAPGILPENYLHIVIEILSPSQRRINIQ
jgi:tRNA threonylcarbamoyladenosine biosynthesis protein TsaE